nr:TPA_asm: acintoc2 [Ladona dragonfly adintovirus]
MSLKKYLLVEPNSIDRSTQDKQLTLLDGRMSDILKNRTMNDSEKWFRYSQVLNDYINIASESRRPVKIPILEEESRRKRLVPRKRKISELEQLRNREEEGWQSLQKRISTADALASKTSDLVTERQVSEEIDKMLNTPNIKTRQKRLIKKRIPWSPYQGTTKTPKSIQRRPRKERTLWLQYPEK